MTYLGSSPTLKPADAISATAAIIILSVALSEIYSQLGLVFGETWIGAASLHTLMSFVVVLGLALRGKSLQLTGLKTVADNAPEFLRRRPWLMYLPAGMVLTLALLAVFISRQFAQTAVSSHMVSVSQIAWISWVPIVEEIVFRMGFGRILRLWLGNLWGCWFSAIFFAMVHASPTIMQLLEGKLGLPIGPFILGLSCEVLFILTGRLAAVATLHAACNATAMIFAIGDSRWLNWLGFLYG